MGFIRTALCKRCEKPFVKKAANQKFCEECSYWRRYEGGSVMKALHSIEGKLKKEADQSGNPKVWTAGKYSQEFLRSLVTRQ